MNHARSITLLATAGALAACRSRPAPALSDASDAIGDTQVIVLDALPAIDDAAPFRGVKVTTTGTGSGTAIATVDGALCDAECLENLSPGMLVHVTATADPGSWFRGWLAGCSGRHACDVVAADNLAISADFTPEPNRVFVSSTRHDGDFGGIAGGDALCQQLATRAALTGTYHILLNSSTSLWNERAPGARGWIRVDGEPVGDTGLGSGSGLYDIRLDELGNDVGADTYWAFPSETLADGTRCYDWTLNIGATMPSRQAEFQTTTRAAQIDQPNTHGIAACNELHRFLCAEIDRSVAITPVATKGRLAFMTKGTWDTTTGIASADQLCASEARAARRPGTFKALLATPTASAISRFDTSGPPWVRIDGMPLLAAASSFESAAYLDVAPGVAVDGSLQSRFTAIPFGAPDFHTPGALDSTCDDWTTGENTHVSTGFSSWSTSPVQLFISCSQWGALCLEE